MDEILNIHDSLLKKLLIDKTTNKNIKWGTSDYENGVYKYTADGYIYPQDITGTIFGVDIKPRVIKAKDVIKTRIKTKAEVFTPSYICNEQNNKIDQNWFEKENIFNTPKDKGWITNKEKVEFKNKNDWKKYVDAKRLEITCGEAPYLVSRYDTYTGEKIPLEDRIGILDRKIRIVNENAKEDEEWNKWILRAFQSVYGYEFQGDSLLLARMNLLYTFIEYYKDRYNTEPDIKILNKIVNIISWNIWQMDGLKYIVPYSYSNTEEFQNKKNNKKLENGIHCKIMDWRKNKSVKFISYINNTNN